ncbi:MAG: diaminopimelate epimerase [candidate division NC10 bacterium RIFCSPLOWO2_12_FULL_66_18]|nr:MAG: diaminopimelate epimerase [candidate division NC10 bacterium RIFCSPLOWO2_12_FULL_66_18]
MGTRLQRDQFVKSHALGNDYIVLDEAQLSRPLTPGAVRRICDNHYGIGSDGILLLTAGVGADFGVRIFNPDGGEAEKSGNGLRILAKFLYDHGYTDKPDFTVSTPGGRVRARLSLEDGRVSAITADMGRATFVSSEIPVAGPRREVVKETLEVAGRQFTVTAVSIGNPHCVIFAESLDEDEVRRLGPAIEHHPSFPNRINVQFAKVLGRDRVSILIWERGAGYTLASGTSSCAVASVCVKNGLTDRRVTIESPGGELRVSVGESWDLTLTGPASEICAGALSQDLLRSLSA